MTREKVHNSMAMSDTLSSGQVLSNRYQLRRMLGEGGFAEVYEALDLTLGRQVAVKLLKDESGEAEAGAEARFLREAKFASQINHPDIVTIFDIGRANERPFIVMELVEGHSLARELWLHGPMPPEKAYRLFVRMLHAMAKAHDHGVIHRDLKPSNLMLSYRGEVVESLRVLDFGIAFYFGDAMTRLTKEGHYIGTPEYLSPEYIRDHQITPALDVYQLGLIFVEMLIGRTLVALESPMQCLFAHCSGRVVLPQYLAESPAGPVLKKALAIEVHERYQNAAAFLTDFAALKPQDIPSLPAGAAPETMVLSAALEPVATWSRSFEHLIQPDQPVKKVVAVKNPLRYLAPLAGILVLIFVGLQLNRGEQTPTVLSSMAPQDIQPEPKVIEPAIQAAPQADAAPAASHRVRVITEPADSDLFENNVLVGSAPLSLEVGEKRRVISVRRSGFADRDVLISAESGDVINVRLEPRVLSKKRLPVVADPVKPEAEAKPALQPFD